jgi:sulfur transfer complex TusBCD TusB component (DsrH family)
VERLLGSWHQEFRFFLKALNGEVCPLCAVAGSVASVKFQEIARHPEQQTALCGAHLSALLRMADAAAQVVLTQSAVRKSLERDGSLGLECELCRVMVRATDLLARIIAVLDRSLRFEKAIGRGPLFCRVHVGRVTARGYGRNFARIQRGKVEELINDMSQAQLLRRPDLNSLIEKAATYLGTPSPNANGTSPDADSFEGEPALESAASREFAQWEEEQKNAHLDKLESEVASLRYRNAVLSEENRRFRLAHAAVEALRRDLERDRAELRATGVIRSRAASNND